MSIGQTFPYDTGVAMEIDFYRAVRFKTIQCDSLMINSENEILAKNELIEVQIESLQLSSEYIDKNRFILKRWPFLFSGSFLLGLILGAGL